MLLGKRKPPNGGNNYFNKRNFVLTKNPFINFNRLITKYLLFFYYIKTHLLIQGLQKEIFTRMYDTVIYRETESSDVI